MEVDDRKADIDVEEKDAAHKEHKQQINLDVLVGVVEGSLALAIHVHDVAHQIDPTLHGGHQDPEVERVQGRGHVDLILKPIPTPVQAILPC